MAIKDSVKQKFFQRPFSRAWAPGMAARWAPAVLQGVPPRLAGDSSLKGAGHGAAKN